MERDFVDAPLDGAPGGAPGSAAGVGSMAPAGDSVRRPVNGGWVLIGAAALLAVVTNYAVLSGGEPTTRVAVLTAAAPTGTAVADLQASSIAIDLDDPSAHMLLSPEDLPSLADRITGTPLEVGVMLRTTDLRVAADVGLGAMSLPIDPSRAVGGLLLAGDLVDVIASTGEPGELADAEYVAQGLRVLEVIAPGTGVGQAGRTYAVTVSVDDVQALDLARAVRRGDIDIIRTAGGGGR